MSDRDDLQAELKVAKQHGRGTDVARIKKQLGALGEPAAAAVPAPAVEVEQASEARAAAAESRTEAPKARTSPRSRQSQS